MPGYESLSLSLAELSIYIIRLAGTAKCVNSLAGADIGNQLNQILSSFSLLPADVSFPIWQMEFLPTVMDAAARTVFFSFLFSAQRG